MRSSYSWGGNNHTLNLRLETISHAARDTVGVRYALAVEAVRKTNLRPLHKVDVIGQVVDLRRYLELQTDKTGRNSTEGVG